MEKDNKIVLGAIAILIVMIFIFNSSITGQASFFSKLRFKAPAVAICSDIDGDNPNKLGYVKLGNKKQLDFCSTSGRKERDENRFKVSDCSGSNCYVAEYICSNNNIAYKKVGCENGCKDGACKREERYIPGKGCTDSDGGKNYYVKGTVKGDLSPFGTGYEGKIGTVYDFCVQLDENGNYPWVNEPLDNNTWNRHEVKGCISHCAIYEMFCDEYGRIGTVVPSCPNGCKDGACLGTRTGTFKIAGISGRKNSYALNEKVTLEIKGVEPDGTPAEPNEGFNVQYGIQSITNDKTYSGGNAEYKNGYWYATIQLPGEVGYYNLIIYLYCSRDDAICAEKYGKATQVEDWSALNVVNLSGGGGTEPMPSNYLPITIQFKPYADLSGAEVPANFIYNLKADEKIIALYATNNDGFSFIDNPSIKTGKIWLVRKPNDILIFYHDINHIPALRYIDEIDIDETKDLIKVKNGDIIQFTPKSSVVNIEYHSNFIPGTLYTYFGIKNGEIASLGDTWSLAEPQEIDLNEGLNPTRRLGTYTSDYTTKSGTIIKNPKLNGDSDKVVLNVPL